MNISGTYRFLAGAALLLATVSPLHAQRRAKPVSVRGHTLEIRTTAGEQHLGELIGVGQGRALLENAEGSFEVELGQIQRARLQRHGLTTGKAWRWVAIGAAVSGIGMTIACSSVEDAECAGVLPGVGLSWALVGGLFAMSLGRSAWEEVVPFQERLEPYARFPQGIPPGYERRR